MKNLLFSFWLLQFSLFSQAQNKNADCNLKIYTYYTHQTFPKSPIANQRITPSNINTSLLNAAIFYESNRQRAKYQLPLFKLSKALEKAAYAHSKDMVRYNFYSHKSRVKGKKNMIDRLALVGIENTLMAENIAEIFAMKMKGNKSFYPPSVNGGYFSYQYKGKPIKFHTYISFARELVAGWMNSPGHRRNLMHPKLRYLGCGAYYLKPRNRDDVPMFRCTQNFSASDTVESQ